MKIQFNQTHFFYMKMDIYWSYKINANLIWAIYLAFYDVLDVDTSNKFCSVQHQVQYTIEYPEELGRMKFESTVYMYLFGDIHSNVSVGCFIWFIL